MVVEIPQNLYKVYFSEEEVEILTKAAEIIQECSEKCVEFDYYIAPHEIKNIEDLADIAQEVKNLTKIIGVCTTEGCRSIDIKELW